MVRRMPMARRMLIGITVAVVAGMVLCCASAAGTDQSHADTPTFEVVDKTYVQGHLEDSVIVDVRTADEYDAGHIEGALNIDSAAATPDDFFDAQIGFDEQLILYCRTGRRARAVATDLVGAGYTNVKVYEPGYPDWAS